MNEMPDVAITLAVVALYADGPTAIRDGMFCLLVVKDGNVVIQFVFAYHKKKLTIYWASQNSHSLGPWTSQMCVVHRNELVYTICWVLSYGIPISWNPVLRYAIPITWALLLRNLCMAHR